jgi:hypothetical protein
VIAKQTTYALKSADIAQINVAFCNMDMIEVIYVSFLNIHALQCAKSLNAQENAVYCQAMTIFVDVQAFMNAKIIVECIINAEIKAEKQLLRPMKSMIVALINAHFLAIFMMLVEIIATKLIIFMN